MGSGETTEIYSEFIDKEILLLVDDVDSDVFTYDLVNSPEWMQIDQSGLLSWVPAEGISSSGLVELEVSDGEFIAEQLFEVIVISVNDAPELILEFDDILVSEGASDITIDLTQHFYDSDGDDLEYFIDEDLIVVTTSIINGNLTISFIDNLYGSGSATITATDGEYSVSDVFLIEVIDVNDAPELVLPLNDITVNEDAEDINIDLSL